MPGANILPTASPGTSCHGCPIMPLTSSTSRLLLLGMRGKLPELPVRLGFEGARYRVLRGFSTPPSDAPFCATDASAAAEGPAAAARKAATDILHHSIYYYALACGFTERGQNKCMPRHSSKSASSCGCSASADRPAALMQDKPQAADKL